MGLSVRQVFEAVALAPSGPVQWGTRLSSSSNSPGVYVVSVTGGPDKERGIPWPGCDMEAVEKWLAIRDGKMTVEGRPANIENLPARISEFWFEAGPIIYIGMTDRTLRARMDALFFNHTLGKKRPHRGGHWLQALANRRELFVFWAATNEAASTESRMIAAFRNSASPAPTNGSHRRAEYALPFANLEVKRGGPRKPHGLKYQTD
jgi:hypothetical protein